MKKYYIFTLLLLPFMAGAQLKQIAFAELTAGSGMFFGAEMTPTTITVTVQGPSDRWLGFGFGSGMANGNDAIIWSTTTSGAGPLTLRDHRMIGVGSAPPVDAQQDWTVSSNTVSGSTRTIIASRALSTGDANDVTFNFSATSQLLFWAKGISASNTLSNHGAANRANGIVRNWVLVDQTPPTLTSTNPVDNAVGVSLTQNLSLTFSENISWGPGSISLFTGAGTLVQTISNGSAGVTISGNTLTWNPTANLVLNSDYYVQVSSNAIKDAAGNFYAGIADNTTWNFNTNDVVAPTVTASGFTPADNATGVPLTTTLSVTFSEPVQAGTGTVELYLMNGTLVETFTVATSLGVAISGATLTIDPSADLVFGNDYYVNISNDAIEDMSGNAFAGISANTTWNFSTTDVVAPAAITFTPADNSTNVSLNPTIQITFNEPVEFSGSGSFELHSGATLVETFSQVNGNLSITGAILTFIPTAPLSESSAYYIVTNGTAITDTSGNAMSALATNSDWNFTTGDFTAPTVATSGLTPADDATNVDVSVSPTITFNESVMLGTGEFRLVNDATSAVEIFSSALGNATVSGTVVTLNPAADLASNTGYHIEVDNDAVMDASGNAYTGITGPTMWNFTTENTTGLNELANAGFLWNGSELKVTDPSVTVAEIFTSEGKLVQTISTFPAKVQVVSGVYLLRLNGDQQRVARIYVN